MSKLALIILACAFASTVSEPLLLSAPLVTGPGFAPAIAPAYSAYSAYSGYAPLSAYSAYMYGPGYLQDYIYSPPVALGGVPYAYSADYIYRR